MASNVQSRRLSDLSGVRRGALVAYRWFVLAFLLAGCAQVFLAGLGVFSFGDGDTAGAAAPLTCTGRWASRWRVPRWSS